MDIPNLSPKDEEESLSSDSQFNLSSVIKEEFELENFDIPETNPQSNAANFMKFTFSPSIVFSLLSIAFVIERNGIISSSFVLFYGLIMRYLIWDKRSKLVLSQHKIELRSFYKNRYTQQIYNVLCVFYYSFFQLYLLLIFKDFCAQFLNELKAKNSIWGKLSFQSLFCNGIFFLLSCMYSFLSNSIQSTIFLFSLIFSSLLLFFLVIRTLYFNCKVKYGANRSLQLDNFTISLVTSFSFVHFAFGPLPSSHNKSFHNHKFSLKFFSSNLIKIILLFSSGYIMYFSYGRYINTTQLFSFHENDISANLCRFSYIIATISTSLVTINQLVFFVNELVDHHSFDSFVQNHKFVTSSLFLLFLIVLSFFVEASLPLIELCGAISFWIFDVVFTYLLSLSLQTNKEGCWHKVKPVIIITVSLLMFGCTIFCSIGDFLDYYRYE